MDGHRGFPHPVRASTVSPLCFWLSSFLTHPGTCPWWPSHSLYVLHHWHIKFWKMLKPFVPLFFSLACVTQHGFADNQRHLCSTEPSGAVTTHRRESCLLFLIKQLPLFFSTILAPFYSSCWRFFITKRKDGGIATHSAQRAFAPIFQVLLPLLQGHFDFLH